MERLFYILEGGVDHDDSFNDIQGHMATGDLGILTEGERGMVHSEWNHEDEAATRAYILVYPTDPTPRTASFDAIRDEEAPRTRPADGVHVKTVVDGGDERLHGDLRRFVDVELARGASRRIDVDGDEGGLLFVVGGTVEVRDAEGARVATDVAEDHAVLLPPSDGSRVLQVEADAPSRILLAVTGRGFGMRRR